jgi:hypothetical protein
MKTIENMLSRGTARQHREWRPADGVCSVHVGIPMATLEFRRLRRPEINAAMASLFTETMDKLLIPDGFARRKGSINYRRKTPDGFQDVKFQFELHPRTQPDGIHLIPHIEVTFPRVDEIAERLVGSELMRFPILEMFTEGFQMPLMGSDPSSREPRNLDELTDLIEGNVRAVLEDPVLPVLSRVKTISGLANISSDDAFILLVYGRRRWYNVAVASIPTRRAADLGIWLGYSRTPL